MTSSDWTHLPLTDLSFQVMLALAEGPQHGYAILQAISSRTGGRVEPATGTLYTALRRLVSEQLVEPAKQLSSDKRRGRSYRLTELGRRVASLEARRLAALVAEARRSDLLPAGEYSG